MTRFSGTVTIESLVQPEDGAIIFMRCPDCRRLDIAHSPYAIKPEDGDVWLFSFECFRCAMKPRSLPWPTGRLVASLNLIEGI